MLSQPEPQSLTFSVLVNDIERGHIKIPQFQRDFVWSREKSAKLLDSILKGYPIGTFILWKTKESLRTVKNIGGASLPDTPAGDFTQHVLDGQQRLTSLYASIRGLKVRRDARVDDFSEMYIDLHADGEQDIVSIDPGDRDPASLIKVVDLLSAGLTALSAYPAEYHARLEEYKRRLETYAFSVVLVKEAPLDVATEIFTRINVTGKPLSVFEIMVAKTFDAARGFDLADEYDRLAGDLRNVDYDTISPSVVLQAVAMMLAGECTKKDILSLPKADFIDVWTQAVDAIYLAVDYFRNYYRIPVSNLLPFGALLVPFSYFFFHHRDRPTGETQRYLEDFFWRASLGGRYSHSVESNLAADIRRIRTILDGSLPEYDFAIDTTTEFVGRNGYFSTGRSYVKALLCVLAFQEPKSFVDGSLVRISNDWLKQANSRNYHHFFPRSYLKKQGHDDDYANHIANITIVDDFLNKREIHAKPPATYMRSFEARNPTLRETMRTHLIDVDGFGIWENDYDMFFRRRCQVLAAELQRRIIPQQIDQRGQEASMEDADDEIAVI